MSSIALSSRCPITILASPPLTISIIWSWRSVALSIFTILPIAISIRVVSIVTLSFLWPAIVGRWSVIVWRVRWVGWSMSVFWPRVVLVIWSILVLIISVSVPRILVVIIVWSVILMTWRLAPTASIVIFELFSMLRRVPLFVFKVFVLKAICYCVTKTFAKIAKTSLVLFKSEIFIVVGSVYFVIFHDISSFCELVL